tara:strand:- start:128 stop:691 length:564 start_codon:yes stop_codon:yes gene_type:complete
MQRGSLQFSITQPSQFDFKGAQLFDPTNVMRGSVINEEIQNIINNSTGINRALTPEQQLQLFLNQEGGDVDIEDYNRFEQQGLFSKALDFAQRPDVSAGLGYLFGGLPGVFASFALPSLKSGITSLIDRFRPAPNIPTRTIGDTDMSRNVTTGSGQSVSDSDLSSIGDTWFSEYSDPGTAASYEGSF